MRMIIGAFSTMFIFGLLRMKPWAVLLLIGFGLFAMDAHAVRMDFDCEDHKHDDLASLACNIYWEGRNQNSEGMLAVAAVTMWRVKDPEWPGTVADVVWEKRWSRRFERHIPMFTWTLDGHIDRPFENEQEQWDEAWTIARNFALSAKQKDSLCPHIKEQHDEWNEREENGEVVQWHEIECEAYDQYLDAKFYILTHLDKTGGATLYHADYVDPWWRPHYKFSVQIGNHLFYLNERIPFKPEPKPELDNSSSEELDPTVTRKNPLPVE